jgi:hypothetical protein
MTSKIAIGWTAEKQVAANTNNAFIGYQGGIAQGKVALGYGQTGYSHMGDGTDK